MSSHKEPQCVRCGHLAIAGSEEGFLETPCSHLYCSKCVHRLFSLQSRISCATCGRVIFRHELSTSTMSTDDQFFHIVGNTRKRVCGIMNKERSDFDQTPAYDDFLEQREDLINKFVALYDTTGTTIINDTIFTREELEKILHRFEVENQEQIIQTRSTSDERKRKKIEQIIATEGTLYDRVNVDYAQRDSVIDHELAVQYSDLLSTDRRNRNHTSLDLVNRKTRQIKTTETNQPSMLQIVEASGCKNLWLERTLDVIKISFKNF